MQDYLHLASVNSNNSWFKHRLLAQVNHNCLDNGLDLSQSSKLKNRKIQMLLRKGTDLTRCWNHSGPHLHDSTPNPITLYGVAVAQEVD